MGKQPGDSIMAQVEQNRGTSTGKEQVHSWVNELWDEPDPRRRLDLINLIANSIAAQSPNRNQPISTVLWVPFDQVEPNDYNPNSVASKEMGLFHTSIMHDGYTQPVVTIYDVTKGKYVIVDGFHRHYTGSHSQQIKDRTNGRVPIVVLQKGINDRMAATVRHNRARGEHSVSGMSSMVYAMLKQGWTDADICNEIGLEPAELLRLKHITGFSKLFKDVQYGKAWKKPDQIAIERDLDALGKTPQDE